MEDLFKKPPFCPLKFPAASFIESSNSEKPRDHMLQDAHVSNKIMGKFILIFLFKNDINLTTAVF
jgi:hypothetical protein